jgi:hypothetical protein
MGARMGQCSGVTPERKYLADVRWGDGPGVRRLWDRTSLSNGVGDSLLGGEREALAVGDLRVLVPPLPRVPPTPDSVVQRHVIRKRRTRSG